VLALCVGLAFLPLTGEENAFRFRLAAVAPAGTAAGPARTAPAVARSIRATTLLVVGAFLIGSFWSFQSLEAAFSTTSARSYIATARAAVADAPRGTLIVDQPTPAMLMDPALFRSQGYTSQVIGALASREPARRLSWTLSPRGEARNLMIFDAQGQLRPAILEGPSSGPPAVPTAAPRASGKAVRKLRGKAARKARGKPPGTAREKAPGQACWTVTAAGTTIPLHGSLYRWPWSVRLDYSGPATGPAPVLAVRFGAKWTDVTLPAGSHAVYVPAVGAGSAVSVRLTGPAPGLCVTGVTVGSLHPRQAGPAIPAVPVPG
jgi:hypothetical protein